MRRSEATQPATAARATRWSARGPIPGAGTGRCGVRVSAKWISDSVNTAPATSNQIGEVVSIWPTTFWPPMIATLFRDQVGGERAGGRRGAQPALHHREQPRLAEPHQYPQDEPQRHELADCEHHAGDRADGGDRARSCPAIGRSSYASRPIWCKPRRPDCATRWLKAAGHADGTLHTDATQLI